MGLEELDFGELPSSIEEAFPAFVRIVTDDYKKQYKNDRSVNSDQNGNYDGTYEPERSYVTAILAFLDEFQIGADLVDISDVEDNRDFYMQFGRFKSKVEYIVTRHRVRIGRLRSGTSGTVLEIELDFKAEIGKHLETVRKIVNKEVNDKKKKDKIIRKIGSLKLEVDRDITTADALFGQMRDLGQAIGETAENLGPAIDKLEKIKKIFWDRTSRVEQLPKPERPKLITNENDPNFTADYDDEIPF